ncbi:hypothetical protein P3T40_007846 [Paraburkholderia sp. EB58]|jgi:hypothetical protein
MQIYCHKIVTNQASSLRNCQSLTAGYKTYYVVTQRAVLATLRLEMSLIFGWSAQMPACCAMGR